MSKRQTRHAGDMHALFSSSTSLTERARPKSQILTRQSELSSTLLGYQKHTSL